MQRRRRRVSSASYADLVLAAQPDDLLFDFPLNDLSGTTAVDASSNGFIGTYTSATLGGAAFKDGSPAALFDGINDFVNVYSAALAAAWVSATFTVGLWFKASNASVWTDGIQYRLLELGDGGNNQVEFPKFPGSGQPGSTYIAGGTSRTVAYTGVNDTNWHFAAFTVDTGVSPNMNGYFDGTNIGAAAVVGTWGGALTNGFCNVAKFVAGSTYFPGSLAHLMAWKAALTDAKIASLYF